MRKNTKALIMVVIMCLALILPVSNVFAKEDPGAKQSSDKNIVDIAISDGRFKTLVEALKAADLVDTLKGNGPFTVFAPTDDAFKKLPAGTLESLLKPENKETLKDILLYHVAKGNITAKDVLELNGKDITLLNGKKAKVTVKDGEVFINDAKVIITDIKASNGVIHVIDTVLIPK